MAHLVLRRSSLDKIGTLSVVYLAIAYAVLTIALGAEWGRIVQGMASVADDYDAPTAAMVRSPGDDP